MKTLITILLLISFSVKAQKPITLTPVIGLAWHGSLSYAMEEELPSLKIGVLKILDQKKYFLNGLELSGSYFYDIAPENINRTERDFYNIKLQATKGIGEYINLVGGIGYINSFSGKLMKSYEGEFKNSRVASIGLQYYDDMMVAELLFESFGGYPHLSAGVSYKILNSKMK